MKTNIIHYIVPVLCSVLLFAGATVSLKTSMVHAAEKPVSPTEIERLTLAPDFGLNDLQGRKFNSSSYKGRVVLLNFWATWCPACLEELPSLSVLAQDRTLKEKGFDVITVAVERSPDPVKTVLKKKRLGLFVLLDEQKSVSRQFKIFSLPMTFLIDRRGAIVEKFFGEYDWTDKEIRAKIEKLL